MNERRMLEMAAKAAGIGIVWLECTEVYCITDSPLYVDWNPLTDDGDALRLAVKLGFSFSIDGRVTMVHNHIDVYEEQAQDFGGDTYATTRRAIVRAAAAIGEAMP